MKCGFSPELNKSKKLKEKKEWDLLITIDTSPFYFEIKNDAKATTTGNIAIEFFNTKLCKPSGISVTAADYWIYVLNLELWATPVVKLKQFLQKNKPCKTILYAGDGNASLYIFKKERILGTVFTRIDQLDRHELTKYLYKKQL